MKISLFRRKTIKLNRKMLVHSQHKSCALLQMNSKQKIEDMCHPYLIALTSFSQVCRKGFAVCILIFLYWLKINFKQNIAQSFSGSCKCSAPPSTKSRGVKLNSVAACLVTSPMVVHCDPSPGSKALTELWLKSLI